jgi:threonine/homoserine/homoserine lactone efflux protein
VDNIWFQTISEGFILGFGLAFLIGPAFFALLKASIDHGFGVSVALAAGVVASDILLMALSYSLLQKLEQIPWFHEILALLGGAILIGTGIQTIRTNPGTGKPLQLKFKDIWPLFRKGFSINTFNPFPWMFWLSTSAMVKDGIGKAGVRPALVFFATSALTVFSTDVAKAYAAKFLIRHLTPKTIKWFRFTSGLFLVGFGIRLLWFAADRLGWI